MPAPTYLVLDRASALLALEGLSSSRHSRAVPTYTDILTAFNISPNGGRSIRLPINDGLGDVLRSVHVRPGLVSSVRHCRYVATYRHPEDPTVPDVTIRSYDRPRLRRTLNGPGGLRRYIRVTLHKEEYPMAARTTRTRAKSRAKASAKAQPAEELDDLEALEELEDLEDIEEDEPTPAKRGRSRAKAKAKAKPEPEDEDEEDEDEEDEDDEDEDDEDEEDEDDVDEEPTPRKRRASRTAKPAARSTSKRSATSAAKAKAKPAAKKSAVGASGPRPVPGGKLSVTDVADMAGTNGAAVRQWLRRNDWPKDEELGRYTFTKKEAASIVKKLNA